MKKIFWWTDEIFYKQATPLGKVLINVIAPFYYGYAMIRERISRIRR